MGHLVELLQQRKLTGLAAGLLVALLGLLVALTPTGQMLENRSLDVRFRLLRDGTQADTSLVVIEVAEKDLLRLESGFGRWPWPRALHGFMVEYLTRCGVNAIAFDVIFAEQSFSTVRPDQVAALAQQVDALPAGDAMARLQLKNRILSLYSDDDGQLANATRGSECTIHALHFSGVTGAVTDSAALAAAAVAATPAVAGNCAEGFGPLLPVPVIRAAARRLGHISMTADEDGPVRGMQLLMRCRENGRDYLLPALSLSTFITLHERATGRPAAVAFDGAQVRVDDRLIPLAADGRMIIDYTGGKYTYPYVNYSDVIDAMRAELRGETAAINPAFWRGKTVFIGATAAGLMDLRVNPFEADYPGVELHVNLLDQMLHNRYLTRHGTGLLALILLVLNGVLGWAAGRVKPVAGALALLGVLAAYTALSFACFAQHFWLATALPLLTAVLTYLVVLLHRFFSEEKEKRFVRNAFQHYLSRDVVDAVLQNRQALKLGGERRELTVLFSDIRSFTTMSESMQPEEVVLRLNEYLTAMTDIVLKYRGMLDKYVGDAVMAVFGAPLGQHDHAACACVVALEMMAKLRELQEQWRAAGKVVFDIGIGVNTGMMFVGNMGS